MTMTFVSKPPAQGAFGGDIPFSVVVKSGTLPLSGVTVTVGGQHAQQKTGVTDESGQATVAYSSTFPGTNPIEVTASKPGYKDATLKSSINLAQSVNIIVKAVTAGPDQTGNQGKEISAQLKIEAPQTAAKNYNSDPGSPIKFTNAKYGTYKITAPATFSNSAGKFTFLHWSDGVADNPRSFNIATDTIIEAIYSAQYLLQVSTDYGTASGGGYYNEGSIATISIDSTSTSGGLIDRTFAGWSGDISSDSPTTQITMDGPKVVKAEWNANYLKIAIIAGAAGGAGIIAYLKIIKPKKERSIKQ